ncbi:nitrile hydratase subunit beta [Mycolicibacterium baixiangningiae]|uniref:nitrile hydratase subunit beta n=1 Tax=Mycolicibacterium baixiangningiae TaxID=2761578 RepID=UPI0018D1B0F3|nr:nitrile hydratase subunit beta [Mycolicibacterium baixiangningiae]
MKLQHTLGGLEGLGAVNFEKRVFVEEWEKRIFGIHTAFMGLSDSLRESTPGYDLDIAGTSFRTTWTWADLRKGAEAMNPFDYFRFRYYEKWLGGIMAYCVEHGYVTEDELTAALDGSGSRIATTDPQAAADGLDEQVLRYLREGDSPRRGPATPKFAVGDHVVIANPPTGDHTRLPGYLRGHKGIVESVAEGNYTYFCSTGADGLGEPLPVYIVRFEGDELWGSTAEAHSSPLYAELYEPYLTTTTDAEKAARA